MALWSEKIVANEAYTQRINRVMDHVRQHLDGDHSLEKMARIAHFSPFHFHRIFRAIQGETLVSFSQRARLERAAYLMRSSPERTLTSIAMEVGFSASSDFSRVFKRRYGLAPSQWDRKGPLHEGIEEYEDMLAEARREFQPSTEIVSHEPCRVAYIRMQTAFIGPILREGYGKLTSWLQARGIPWQQLPLLGLSWDNHETTDLEQVHFDFGFAVPEGVEAQGDIGIHELPAMRSVHVRCQGPLSFIAVAWDFLYDQWLPQSQYEPDDMPAIKRFRTRPDELGWDQWDLDCSIAIRPMLP